jgi:uncharacterized protein (TIGR03083 family)
MTQTGRSDPLEELWSALAEGDAQEPPSGLGGRILRASLEERPAGRPTPPVAAISPVEALDRQVTAFDSLLDSLERDEWSRPVLRDLDIQGLVGHLIGVETEFQRSLERAVRGGAAGEHGPGARDHVASTQRFAVAQSGRAVEQTHADWHEQARRSLDRLSSPEAPSLDAEVVLHSTTLPLRGLLVVRAFELWTHDEDIRRATGRPLAPPGPSSLTLMTELAIRLLPAVVGGTEVTGDGAMARIVLTGSGGGCWTMALGAPEVGPARVRIVADAVDFCRLVADRISPSSLPATITGDQLLGVSILRGAPALALD